ncbi:hypothetical protein G6F42_020687 [Rhizopus arrhizus]|nr:hypothetical protein G6F42_020687 [Rhizopus arrhizus]
MFLVRYYLQFIDSDTAYLVWYYLQVIDSSAAALLVWYYLQQVMRSATTFLLEFTGGSGYRQQAQGGAQEN